MILILNLCSSLLEIVSALAIMGIMLTWGKVEKGEEVRKVTEVLENTMRQSSKLCK